MATNSASDIRISSTGSSDVSSSVQDVLSDSLSSVTGIQAACVSTLFGLPVVRAVRGEGDDAVITAAETAFAPVFYSVTELSRKLPVGSVKTVCADYGEFKLVQATVAPLIVCLVCSPSTDEEAASVSAVELARALAPLQQAAESLTSERADE